MTKRAAIYARISNDREGESLGVQRQEQLCRELAERRGVEVAEVFIDNDTSASTRSSKPRPQYADMVQRAGMGEFGTILAYSYSRLTRRPQEFNELIELSEKKGVKIATIASGEFDLNLASGRAVARTVAAWDAAEAEQTSERIKAQKQQRAARGEWHGGTPPFGYSSANKLLLPIPAEVEQVHEAARRIIAGDSLSSVVKSWNAERRTTRFGKHWRQTNLRSILTNRSLLGETKAGVVGWEPILDARTFDRLGRIFDDPARKVVHSPGVKGGKYSMGGGLTVCAICGHRLITGSHHQRVGLKCTKIVNGPTACGRVTVNHEWLETYVFEVVVASLERNDRWHQRRDAPDPTEDQKIADLEAVRDDLDAQKRRVDDMHIRGALDEREHLAHSARIKSERDEVSRQIGQISGTTRLTDALADGLDWRSWSSDRRRNFLRIVLQRVEVGPFPAGKARTLPKRNAETEDEYQERLATHIREVMAARVTIVT